MNGMSQPGGQAEVAVSGGSRSAVLGFGYRRDAEYTQGLAPTEGAVSRHRRALDVGDQRRHHAASASPVEGGPLIVLSCSVSASSLALLALRAAQSG